MNLKPTKRNLVVRFIQPAGNVIISAATETLAPTVDSKRRTRVEVIQISKTLSEENEISVGDFLLLRPGNLNVIPISDTLALINADVIEAIVLDDKIEPTPGPSLS